MNFLNGVTKRIILIVCLVFFTAITYAANLRGIIVENRSKEPLIAATILVINEKDTTNIRHVSTDNDGAFVMRNLSTGSYKVSVNYLGYSKVEKKLSISNEDVDMGTIRMRRDAVELDAVQIKAQAVRATQRGDTTEFNAEAYKVTQDASAEDLIKKLPGITVEGGTVKTQGEDVKKVLVDGKPFFGDDPTIAIRNLPAEVIDKIEVFDRMSDQSQLTGFDDGESVKTLNIVTKENRKTGQFGRMYAAGGYDDTEKDARYSVGGNISLFNNVRRISIIGMSNNVNQQNFASEDLSAVSGGGRGRRNAFSGGGGSGIATTHAIGVNYSDMWGKKVEVSGSYFFNYVDKNTSKELAREYFSEGDTTQYYNENSNSNNVTYNNRLNFKLDYKISDQTSLMFQPSLSFQTSSTSKEDINEMLFNTLDFGNQTVSKSKSFNNTDNKVFNFNNELLLRHKFQKQGRTFSVRIRNNIGDATASNMLESEISRDSTEIRNQQWDNPTNNWSANGNVTYTEPLSKSSIIQVNYDFSYSHGESNKETYNLPSMELDSLFSSIYNNNYITHRAGGSYRYRSEKSNLTLGVNYQIAMLDGTQIMPQKPDVSKSFNTILPMARFDFKFSKHQALRFFYRTSTNAPSVNQLQNVVDNSNPLILTTGNPNLSESYNHMMSLRYNQTSLEKGTTFFAMLYASATQNNITTKTITAKEDMVDEESGIFLEKGTQLSKPVNLDGYRNFRGVVTFGFPLNFIKSNLNLTTSGSYTRQPGYINEDKNIANNYAITEGIVLSSNVSENLDFTLSYNGSYNITKNSLQTRQNNNYFRQDANGSLTWIFWKGITLQTVARYEQYRGLSEGYNEEYVRWDASIGKKFLKNNRGELKFTVYDILNQNKSYSRNVTESYIEDSRTAILSRYFLLTFTYTLRNFGTPPKREGDERRGSRDGGVGYGGPPPGMPMR